MKVTLYAIPGIPLIKPGDNLGEIIDDSASRAGFALEDNDVLVVAQKIVSKAENRLVNLDTVKPSQKATRLAKQVQIDPRHAEVVLRETKTLLRIRPGILIAEHRLGFIASKAGVDRSNATEDQGQTVTLIPEDSDLSAHRIRETIQSKTGKRIVVIINDSFGRPYREGSVGMAIGIAGISAIHKVNKPDLFGRELHNQIALVDEIAAAASILMGQANERRPVIVVRGVDYQQSESDTIAGVLRPYEAEILEIAAQIKKNRRKPT